MADHEIRHVAGSRVPSSLSLSIRVPESIDFFPVSDPSGSYRLNTLSLIIMKWIRVLFGPDFTSNNAIIGQVSFVPTLIDFDLSN
ncbi:hypothetical protein BLOT_014805 [Blomia tropicalis]|nr:hypothetical protein BLOT_014805 [Blomia tropicalis]